MTDSMKIAQGRPVPGWPFQFTPNGTVGTFTVLT
jgi:hypothetical protein